MRAACFYWVCRMHDQMDREDRRAPLFLRPGESYPLLRRTMRKIILCAAATIAVPFIALAQSAGNPGKSASITGWVMDSACAYTKGIDKPVSVSCAKACARKGSPLVILGDDGNIFLPIDSKTPASSQNAKLMPFAGEHVKVSGTQYTRGDSQGIVIASIVRQAR
jgi:hypothetical protein